MLPFLHFISLNIQWLFIKDPLLDILERCNFGIDVCTMWKIIDRSSKLFLVNNLKGDGDNFLRRINLENAQSVNSNS